jgi:hypothetical protein
MFGVTDEDIARAQRPRSAGSVLVLVLQALLCFAVCLPVTLLDLLDSHDEIKALIQRRIPGPMRIDFEEIQAFPSGPWWVPSSWRVGITALTVRPADPKRPSFAVDRVSLSMPSPSTEGFGTALRSADALVIGLDIEAHEQRPPPPWTPTTGPVGAVRIDRVRVLDASWSAPADPPLGAAHADRIFGELTGVVVRPGARELSGKGDVHLERFVTGGIEVSDVRLPVFTLERSNLHLGGTFQFAGTQAEVSGDIRRFHVRPEVELDVRLSGASLGEVVKLATGEAPDLSGRLDLDVKVQAGGERERGKSLIGGAVRVRDAVLQLPADTRFLVLDLLTVAPWVDVDVRNRVQFQDLDGRIEATRGRFQLENWSYPVGKRRVRVDGTIEQGLRWLFVRLLPPSDAPDATERPGIGLMLWGDGDRSEVRLASREDLLRPDPWVPFQPSTPEKGGWLLDLFDPARRAERAAARESKREAAAEARAADAADAKRPSKDAAPSGAADAASGPEVPAKPGLFKKRR